MPSVTVTHEGETFITGLIHAISTDVDVTEILGSGLKMVDFDCSITFANGAELVVSSNDGFNVEIAEQL